MKNSLKIRKILLSPWNLFALSGVAGRICLAYAKGHPDWTEYVYARGIFAFVSQIIAFITGIFPFSVAEMSIFAGILAVIALIVFFVYKMIKSKGERVCVALSAVRFVIVAVSVVYAYYAFGCGINYYRYTLAQSMELPVTERSVSELAELCKELAIQASSMREELSEDEEGVYVLPMTIKELSNISKEAFEKLGEKYEIFAGNYPGAKRVLLSELMSYTRLTGIYTCWTMEANVNVAASDYSIGSTMCHELSHLRGFIREDEANFVSYLACMESDNIDLRYSGTLLALVYTGNALYAADSDTYFEIAREYYSDKVWADFIANNRYWEKYEEDNPVGEVTTSANDAYLKANAQEDGVKSYGRVVDLLLAARAKGILQRKVTEVR